MSLASAMALDRAGHIERAATDYEEVIAAGEAPLAVLLDLALLYWQATDPGLAAAGHIDPLFMTVAGGRCEELLVDAERRFPRSTAVRFWKRYIAWADLGEPFTPDECEGLLREDPTELWPALHLFAAHDRPDVRPAAEELLRQSRGRGTTGARYVVSVLESAMKRGAPSVVGEEA